MKPTTLTTAKNALSTTGKAITKNPITTYYIGIGIAAVLGIYFVSKMVSKATDINLGNDPNAGGGNQNTTGGNTKPFGATITTNQAQSIAAALHQAMVVFNGTDENRIYSLLKGKNAKDYALISEAFGNPRYDDFGDAFWPFPQKKLGYWLYSELNDNEILKLKQVMPGVL